MSCKRTKDMSMFKTLSFFWMNTQMACNQNCVYHFNGDNSTRKEILIIVQNEISVMFNSVIKDLLLCSKL